VAKHASALRLSAAAKNAEIDLGVGSANLTKDVEVAKINITKDVEVGKANLGKDLDVDKANMTKDVTMSELGFRSDAEYRRLYLEGANQISKIMLQRVAWEEGYVKVFIESQRIKIVAKKEQNDIDMVIDEKDGLWDLEVFTHVGNFLAAPGGGVVDPNAGRPSATQSMLGGAMSGAAAGAMVGGPWGAVAGGVLGAASGLL